MVWRLVSYSEVILPPTPFKKTYIIGIVENDEGERRVVRIDSEYFGLLKTGVEGECFEEWSVFGLIPKFKPKVESRRRKTVVVTGGARGIGAAIALEFARRGYNVAIADLRLDEDAENTLKKLREAGAEACFLEMDVTDEEAVRRSFEKVYKELGGIDVLVNNAGITIDRPFSRMRLEDWSKVLNVNLTGAFICSKEAYKYMIGRGGVIINISSIVGLLGNIAQANYAASKAGLIGLTYTLAKELARYGIRVIAVAPGFARTRMALAVPRSILVDYIRRIPIPRLVEPSEIARLIADLAENEAVTGIVVPIDLGTTIASPKA